MSMAMATLGDNNIIISTTGSLGWIGVVRFWNGDGDGIGNGGWVVCNPTRGHDITERHTGVVNSRYLI